MTTSATTRLLISFTAIGIALCTPTHAENEKESRSDRLKLVTKQVDAYNARDLEGFLATYGEDAVLYDLAADTILASGLAGLRERYTDRFSNSPDLHATILKRLTFGPYVIDHESVIRKKSEPPTEAIAIYMVRGERIRRVWFLFVDAKSVAAKTDNRDTVTKLQEAINDHDVGRAIDLYDLNSQARTLPENELVIHGRAEQSDRLTMSFNYDPEVHVEAIDTIATGNFVVVHERISGSRGNPIEDVVVYNIVNGDIQHTWMLQE